MPVVLARRFNTEAGQKRAARIADGINPIAFSYEQVVESARVFRTSAAENGRDAASLTVTVRANVPIVADAIGDGRPFLGGSPAEIADDLKRLGEAGVDHVLFYNVAPDGIDSHLRLMADLRNRAG
ncbi:hypothetical protein [Paractinoplanes toevensis]|uniref:Uncharacterized protein n=1 Tax=Paractinoplanes toevensis TaxID=571911 RepID=A0A919W3H7_9ACTN|nr:hypothetical protein [Actinoplanes toevensis]GIM90545.1 hypothetical protein Ato02nite_023380 [Actinoplanes toevensis]